MRQCTPPALLSPNPSCPRTPSNPLPVPGGQHPIRPPDQSAGVPSLLCAGEAASVEQTSMQCVSFSGAFHDIWQQHGLTPHPVDHHHGGGGDLGVCLCFQATGSCKPHILDLFHIISSSIMECKRMQLYHSPHLHRIFILVLHFRASGLQCALSCTSSYWDLCALLFSL